MEGFIIAMMAVWFVITIATASHASTQGKSWIFWGAAVGVFGIFGVAAYMFSWASD